MSKIALSMIIKGDEPVETITRCLNSVRPYVDGIFITITTPDKNHLKTTIERYGGVVDIASYKFHRKPKKKEIKWLTEFLGRKPSVTTKDRVFQFDKARNHALAQIPKEFEWFLWIDADDILRGGEHLREVVTRAESTKPKSADSVFLNYIYQAEIVDGKVRNVLIEHLRERLVRNNNAYKWVAPIHETLIEQRPTVKTQDDSMDVLHLSDSKRMGKAIKRNIKTLELSIYDTKAKDPRPIYYLGKAYYDLHNPKYLESCINLLNRYLRMSGWAEERSQAWEYMAEAYRIKKEHNNSIKCCMNALSEDPKFPSIYLSLAMSYLLKEEWDKALHWVKLAAKIPDPETTLVRNPRDLAARALEVIYFASLETSHLDEAWAAAVKLLEFFPEAKEIQDRVKFTESMRQQRELTQIVLALARHLHNTGQRGKLKTLVASIPNSIIGNPFIQDLVKKITPPRVWKENEVAIYCGAGFTSWSPKRITNPKGSFLGGSEEAVIYLSEELSRLGWKVTVYGDPGEDEGDYNGVKWLPYYKFNRNDKFNILVGWRNVAFVDGNFDAKKIYIWSHDVLNPLEHTQERLDKIAKIIVLSQAHRDTIPNVPDNKILISTNGFSEHFPKIKPKNDPYKIIWSSSYDRGLEHLLKIWGDVKKAVPKAELHVFYGWQLFKKFYGDNPERMAWMEKINKLMEQDGVTHHGRVPQPEIEKWHKRCGIWAYPTHFFEINCISAIKSQLWGCVPVCTDFAALKTTVQYGKKVKGDIYDEETLEEFKNALITALKDHKWQTEQREKMMPWARKKFGWNSVAEQWTKEFKRDELREAADTILKHNKTLDKYLPVSLQENETY